MLDPGAGSKGELTHLVRTFTAAFHEGEQAADGAFVPRLGRVEQGDRIAVPGRWRRRRRAGAEGDIVRSSIAVAADRQHPGPTALAAAAAPGPRRSSPSGRAPIPAPPGAPGSRAGPGRSHELHPGRRSCASKPLGSKRCEITWMPRKWWNSLRPWWPWTPAIHPATSGPSPRSSGPPWNRWHPVWTEVEPAPGRLSLVAALPHPEGPAARRTLIINGHLDVVPVAAGAWSRDPFDPHVEAGRLYGRGSADMKGGIAAAICALASPGALGSSAGVRRGVPPGGRRGARRSVRHPRPARSWACSKGTPAWSPSPPTWSSASPSAACCRAP